MSKRLLYLGLFLMVAFSFACKKNKPDAGGDGPTVIHTIKPDHVPAEGVYGNKYSFKLKFSTVGNIKEYGIVYKAWIKDLPNKEPRIEGGSSKIIFGVSPQAAGTIETKEATLAYKDFNDANYRAYAITASGEIIYGEILYIVFA